MSLEVEAEPVASRPAGLTTIAPATFRGVDCAVLAERYAAYRCNLKPEDPEDDPDEIRTSAEPSSENV